MGNDVPEENRWFVAPPAFYQQLRKAVQKSLINLLWQMGQLQL